jgi:hypothetical protein
MEGERTFKEDRTLGSHFKPLEVWVTGCEVDFPRQYRILVNTPKMERLREPCPILKELQDVHS